MVYLVIFDFQVYHFWNCQNSILYFCFLLLLLKTFRNQIQVFKMNGCYLLTIFDHFFLIKNCQKEMNWNHDISLWFFISQQESQNSVIFILNQILNSFPHPFWKTSSLYHHFFQNPPYLFFLLIVIRIFPLNSYSSFIHQLID